MTPPRIVIAEPLTQAATAWLAERAGVVLATPDTLRHELSGAVALVVRTYTAVDQALLDAAPQLRVVGRAGVGLDNIDTDACAQRGVRVVHTPDANTDAVVEYVLAAVFSHLRPAPPMPLGTDQRSWNAARADAMAPKELRECTVGVWGLGRIGSAAARAMTPLAGRVIYHDLRDIASADRSGAEPVSRDELLAQSDILTLHVDGRPENRHLVDAEALALLKCDALLINASRGMVVEARALARHAHAHPAFGATIDVHDPEPVPADHPLRACDRVVLTPHTAAATARAKAAMSWVVKDVWDAL